MSVDAQLDLLVPAGDGDLLDFNIEDEADQHMMDPESTAFGEKLAQTIVDTTTMLEDDIDYTEEQQIEIINTTSLEEQAEPKIGSSTHAEMDENEIDYDHDEEIASDAKEIRQTNGIAELDEISYDDNDGIPDNNEMNVAKDNASDSVVHETSVNGLEAVTPKVDEENAPIEANADQHSNFLMEENTDKKEVPEESHEGTTEEVQEQEQEQEEEGEEMRYVHADNDTETQPEATEPTSHLEIPTGDDAKTQPQVQEQGDLELTDSRTEGLVKEIQEEEKYEKTSEKQTEDNQQLDQENEDRCVIIYKDIGYSLFITSEGECDKPTGFFRDRAVLDFTMDSLLAAFREELVDDLGPDEELVAQIDLLGLEFRESTNTGCLTGASIRHMLQILDQLCNNEEPDSTRELSIHIFTALHPTRRLELLMDKAYSGHPLHQIAHYFGSSEHEIMVGEDEEMITGEDTMTFEEDQDHWEPEQMVIKENDEVGSLDERTELEETFDGNTNLGHAENHDDHSDEDKHDEENSQIGAGATESHKNDESTDKSPKDTKHEVVEDELDLETTEAHVDDIDADNLGKMQEDEATQHSPNKTDHEVELVTAETNEEASTQLEDEVPDDVSLELEADQDQNNFELDNQIGNDESTNADSGGQDDQVDQDVIEVTITETEVDILIDGEPIADYDLSMDDSAEAEDEEDLLDLGDDIKEEAIETSNDKLDDDELLHDETAQTSATSTIQGDTVDESEINTSHNEQDGNEVRDEIDWRDDEDDINGQHVNAEPQETEDHSILQNGKRSRSNEEDQTDTQDEQDVKRRRP